MNANRPTDTLVIAHLTDETGMDGVGRVLAEEAAGLGTGWRIDMRPVAARWRLPARVEADIIVVNFALAWAKLPFLLALRLRNTAPIVIVEHRDTLLESLLARRGRFARLRDLAYGMTDRVVAVARTRAAWLKGLVPDAPVADARPSRLRPATPITVSRPARPAPGLRLAGAATIFRAWTTSTSSSPAAARPA